ncbi:MAG: HPF/RaiA family ribosome-associated protein [Polyangiales bacterium]
MNTQVTFRDMEPSAAVEEHVRRRALKLLAFHDRIVGCRVVVEEPHRHHRKGKRFHVRIDLTVPMGELVVARDPAENLQHEDLHACIESAFDDAERILEDWVRKHRGDVKKHERSVHGRVKRFFPQQDYGFLESESGEDVYFHRNAVLDGAFDRLAIGDRVRYAEEMGDKGPQATFVEVTRHARPSASTHG